VAEQYQHGRHAAQPLDARRAAEPEVPGEQGSYSNHGAKTGLTEEFFAIAT